MFFLGYTSFLADQKEVAKLSKFMLYIVVLAVLVIDLLFDSSIMFVDLMWIARFATNLPKNNYFA